MDRAPSNLADLSPAELQRLTQAHLDGCFAQMDEAAACLKRQYSPARLARKHPILVAAAAAGAGLFLARSIRGARANAGPAAAPPSGPRQSLGQTLPAALVSAISGAAARALPNLVLTILSRAGIFGHQRDR
jgi:hypothetical protein